MDTGRLRGQCAFDFRRRPSDGRDRTRVVGYGADTDHFASLRDDIEQLPDIEVLDSELLRHRASDDLDRMQVLTDVSRTGPPAVNARIGSNRLRSHNREGRIGFIGQPDDPADRRCVAIHRDAIGSGTCEQAK